MFSFRFLMRKYPENVAVREHGLLEVRGTEKLLGRPEKRGLQAGGEEHLQIFRRRPAVHPDPVAPDRSAFVPQPQKVRHFPDILRLPAGPAGVLGRAVLPDRLLRPRCGERGAGAPRDARGGLDGGAGVLGLADPLPLEEYWL